MRPEAGDSGEKKHQEGAKKVLTPPKESIDTRGSLWKSLKNQQPQNYGCDKNFNHEFA